MPANRIKLEPALERRYARKEQRRKLRQIVCKILIVSEGTKTEPNYFKAFRTFNRGTIVYDIEIKGEGDNTINVVDKAIEYKLGARGLRSIFETIMMDAMYNYPSSKKKKFELTLDYAREQLDKSNFAIIASSM